MQTDSSSCIKKVFCGWTRGATSQTHQALEMVHANVWRDVLAASGAGGCRISGYENCVYGGTWLAPGLEHSFVAVLGQHCVETAEKLAKLDFHRL